MVFGANFEQIKKFIKNQNLIGISSKFLHNIRTSIHIRKNYRNEDFSCSHFDKTPCTIAHCQSISLVCKINYSCGDFKFNICNVASGQVIK